MQTERKLQAVALVFLAALAAGCAATKEYTSKLFPTQNPADKDSAAVTLRFLELDRVQPNQEDWVSTDPIMGRDTAGTTRALDKFSEVFPASKTTLPVRDSTAGLKDEKAETVTAGIKTVVVPQEPIARTNPTEGVRTKKTREK